MLFTWIVNDGEIKHIEFLQWPWDSWERPAPFFFTCTAKHFVLCPVRPLLFVFGQSLPVQPVSTHTHDSVYQGASGGQRPDKLWLLSLCMYVCVSVYTSMGNGYVSGLALGALAQKQFHNNTEIVKIKAYNTVVCVDVWALHRCSWIVRQSINISLYVIDGSLHPQSVCLSVCILVQPPILITALCRKHTKSQVMSQS